MKSVLYNHIEKDRIDIIDKLAYLYWYENISKDNWTDNKHEALYLRTKNEVMEYGFGYYKDQERE